MDTKRPYWLTLLLALDRFGAAVIFNRPDLTISTLCWMVLVIERSRVTGKWAPQQGELLIAWAMLKAVDPYTWQCVLLRGIGELLERIQPGHCAAARVSDIQLLMVTQQLLVGSVAAPR